MDDSLSVRMSVCRRTSFKLLLHLQFLSDFHETLHTRDISVNTQKTVEQIFEILIMKFLANFLNFKFGVSLRRRRSGAI